MVVEILKTFAISRSRATSVIRAHLPHDLSEGLNRAPVDGAVKSLDTQILVYALNRDCSEHDRARAVLEEMLAAPADWVLADQILLEGIS